jgi:acyl-homoserine lactone acylase PvdQ
MSRSDRRARWALASLVALAALLATAPVTAAGARDFSGRAFNILPPGQAGDIPPQPDSTDQIDPYDTLTPKLGAVRARDLRHHFKSAHFGLLGRRARVERPGRRGLRVLRDRWGVPHVYARSRSDLMFGAGWIAAEDRGTLMEVIRGPGYIAALDVPGLDPFDLALSLRRFDPSDATRRLLSRQLLLVRKLGRRGRRILTDFRAYAAGINAYNREAGRPIKRWTLTDTIASASLIGAIFGTGGGDEARRSALLSALGQRLGPALGQQVWDDLREFQDQEAPVTVQQPFPYGQIPAQRPGNAVIDAGSFAATAARASHAGPVSAAPRAFARPASNALLVSASRSANGHPLFVAGPQVGYFYPEVLMEMDLHGGGIDSRGVTFAGAAPYVLIGRGKDFAWSATSAGSDVVDEYVEELCGNDTTYRYKGQCRPMTTLDAGLLSAGGGEPERRISFRETVHGPVIGYASVGGRRVALAQRRSTRGREALNALPFAELNSNKVRSARSFARTMSRLEFTFNWFYADNRDIAVFSSGRLPVRAPGVDPGLPTIGTGEYEWGGVLPRKDHPQATNPPGGLILSWNNKPATGFAAADDNWGYGSIHRNQLLEDAVGMRPKHSLTTLVGAMNKAATQDLRAVGVLPAISEVLRGGPAPSERAARMLQLLEDWRARGADRLDRELDGRIDDPGVAIMDAAWPRIADAVMGPVLGPQLEQLPRLITRDDRPGGFGSAYFAGWYGYVDKDLRALLGKPVISPFRTRFCGQGDLGACRAALWGALDAAGAELQAAQGPDPAAWRADATSERIKFEPGLLPRTMRWTNRPTFQQAIYFKGHR